MVPNRWVVFAVLFAARTSIGFQFQSVPALGPYLIHDLDIDFVVLGTLIGCYLLPGVALALPGGLLGQRFGSKYLVVFGLALMVAGGISMASGSVSALFAGRLVSGCGAVLLNVLLTRMIADWFAAEELVAVMGALVASWPLGIALALVSLPPLAAAFGWSEAMFAALVPILVCLGLVAVIYKDPRHSVATGLTYKLELTTREIGSVCVAGLIWGLYNAAYVVFVAALPEFFVQHGYSAPAAAAVTSIFGWVLILSLPLGGYMTGRLRQRSAIMIACFAVIAACACALVCTDATSASVLVLVLVIGLPAGLIMALPAEALPPQSRSIGMGIFFTIFYITMATLPGFAGLIRQRTGAVGSPLLIGAAMMAVAAVCVLIFVAMQRNGRARVRFEHGA